MESTLRGELLEDGFPRTFDRMNQPGDTPVVWMLAFVAPFTLGLGLGLIFGVIVLALKPTVRVRGWLLTGILQLTAVGLSLLGWLLGPRVDIANDAGRFALLWLLGYFVLGTMAMLGPALFVRRRDRRRRPSAYAASPPPGGD